MKSLHGRSTWYRFVRRGGNPAGLASFGVIRFGESKDAERLGEVNREGLCDQRTSPFEQLHRELLAWAGQQQQA
jgi:hypothetical protein